MKRLGALKIYLGLGFCLLSTSSWCALQIAYCPDNVNHAVIIITSDGQHRLQQSFPDPGENGFSHIAALDYDAGGDAEMVLDIANPGTVPNAQGDQLWKPNTVDTLGIQLKSSATGDTNWFTGQNTGTNGSQTQRRIATVAKPGGGTVKCLLTIGGSQYPRISSVDGTTYASGNVWSLNGNTSAASGASGGADVDGDGIDELFYWKGDGLYRCNYNGSNTNEVKFGPIPLSGFASQTLLFGDANGDGTKDVIIVDQESYSNLSVMYAPINSATLPVTWTDSTDNINLPFPPGGGDFLGNPTAIGQINPATPQDEIVYIDANGFIAYIDLVTHQVTTTAENVLSHGFTGSTASGVPDFSDPDMQAFSGPIGSRKGYGALAVGHFVNDSLLGGGPEPTPTPTVNAARHWTMY